MASQATTTQLRAERADAEARRLAGVVRNILLSVDSQHHLVHQPPDRGTPSPTGKGGRPPPLLLLEDLIDVMSAELTRRMKEVTAARMRAEQLERVMEDRSSNSGESAASPTIIYACTFGLESCTYDFGEPV